MSRWEMHVIAAWSVLILFLGQEAAAQRLRTSERHASCRHRHAERIVFRPSVRPVATAPEQLGAILSANSPSFSEPAESDSAVFLDVRYARLPGVDPHLLSLDIHAPPDARGCPVLVYVHGGSWSFGDKMATGQKVPFFTGRGWVVVSVNYRLLPEADLLVQAHDVARAVTWVHERIGRYGGDPDELFLMGHSAGAHLVSLVATDPRWLEKTGRDLSIVRGVVPLDTAALDIVRLMETSADYYGRFFGESRQLWQAASPLAHVSVGKSIPPFLLAVAGNHQATREQAKLFAAALTQVGVRAEILEAPHKTHTTLNRDLGIKGDAVTTAVMEFIDSIRNGRS